MSQTLVVLILLAAPGLIFQFARQSFARVTTRSDRDTVRLLSEVFLSSLPIILVVSGLMNLVGASGSKLFLDFAFGIEGRIGRIDDLQPIFARVTVFLLLVVLVSLLAGLVIGKLVSWNAKTLGGRHALFRMTSGIRPPILSASVLSNTKLGDTCLLYNGTVETVQIGPDGRVDHIVLNAPSKSILRQQPVSDTSAQRKDEIPTALPDFKPIGGKVALEVDRLLIESEDIANVFLHVERGVGRGDFIDRWFARHFARPVVPSQDTEGLSAPETDVPADLKRRR